MGPNNIEHQIKEKLNTREIQPSLQSWDRLDAMLTFAEQKKTKRVPFWFIGIAASVLVLLTAGLFLFNQENISIQNDATIVDTENNRKILEETPATENKQVVIDNDQQEKILKQVQNEQEEILKQEILKQVQNKNQAVSIINQNQKNNQSRSLGTIINRQKEIEHLISGDVAAVKSMPKFISTDPVVVQQKTQEVAKKPSYVDVSVLLASAEGELKVQPKSNKIKVDATTLLSHADGEVEQTFREKVINSVSKNFKEVKVALSNRNKE